MFKLEGEIDINVLLRKLKVRIERETEINKVRPLLKKRDNSVFDETIQDSGETQEETQGRGETQGGGGNNPNHKEEEHYLIWLMKNAEDQIEYNEGDPFSELDDVGKNNQVGNI